MRPGYGGGHRTAPNLDNAQGRLPSRQKAGEKDGAPHVVNIKLLSKGSATRLERGLKARRLKKSQLDLVYAYYVKGKAVQAIARKRRLICLVIKL